MWQTTSKILMLFVYDRIVGRPLGRRHRDQSVGAWLSVTRGGLRCFGAGRRTPYTSTAVRRWLFVDYSRRTRSSRHPGCRGRHPHWLVSSIMPDEFEDINLFAGYLHGLVIPYWHLRFYFAFSRQISVYLTTYILWGYHASSGWSVRGGGWTRYVFIAGSLPTLYERNAPSTNRPDLRAVWQKRAVEPRNRLLGDCRRRARQHLLYSRVGYQRPVFARRARAVANCRPSDGSGPPPSHRLFTSPR